MVFFLDVFTFFLDSTVDIWQEASETERDGIWKGPRDGIRTRDSLSATAPYVGALPTRLSVQATVV